VPVGFTEADIHVSSGLTLVAGSLVQDAGNPLLWTATVNATDNFSGTGTVTVNTGDYTDASGNAGTGGSDTVSIQTLDEDPNDHDAEVLPFSNPTGTVQGSNVFGTPGPDSLSAGNSGQTMYGGAGNDTIIGNNSGSPGDIIFGGSGNDTISGNNGGDTLYGGSGNDTIDGGLGTDTIIGGLGGDVLTGGGANDTFVYSNLNNNQPFPLRDSLVSNFDTITDFNSGNDRFQIGHTVAAADLITGLSFAGTGNLANDLSSVLDSAHLHANGVSEVTISGGGTEAGTYVIIGDGTAGFNPSNDAVIRLGLGLTGPTVHTGDFIV
jgi:serralysin